MIRTLVVIFLFGLSSGAYAAPTVVVRSGEHGTFSRLVMQVPESVEWSLEQGEGQATLNLQMPGVQFDTSQAFDRIPKTRLTGLAQKEQGGALDLTLGCDCQVVGFRHSGALLVIDISDPLEQPAVLPNMLPQIGQNPYRFSIATATNQAEAFRLPVTRNLAEAIGKPKQNNPEPAENANRQTPKIDINASEQRLLEQIGRAADQGLLAPLVPRLPIVRRDADNEPMGNVGIGVAETELKDSPSISVSAETVMDRDMSVVAGALTHLAPKEECLDSRMVALHKWGGKGDFAHQIGVLRSDLFGEFDRPNSAAIVALAKAYLHFGFGAEAREVLLLDPKHEADNKVLFALADIIDDWPGHGEKAFAGQQNCAADVAMWSVLSRPDHAWDANTQAVLQAFARLPWNLRELLGPRLSRIFTGLDDVETASAILRAIDRSDDETGSEQDLAAAEIDQSRGQHELAVEKISAVVESGSRHSPDALVGLIDTQWRERMPVADDIPLLAAAYASEYRNSELGPNLRRVHAIAQAMTGQFDAAFQTLDQIRQNDGSGAEHRALLPVLHLMAENADDVTFLKFGLWQVERTHDAMPGDLEEKLARRMLDLGFAEPALELLATSGLQPASQDRKLMRAEAALLMDLPHRALVELLSLSGPEAARLRAQALRRKGEYRSAGQVLLDTDLTDEASRSLWLSEAWTEVREDSESPYDRMARVSLELTQDTFVLEELTPLARAQVLLDNSQAARSQIGDLLEQAQPVPSAE